VLLGITKAPRYNANGLPLSVNSIRLRLNRSDSDIAAILANRIFLFDPLDRAADNPDFWSMQRCRTEIAQLEHIPQQQTENLFQTILTDSDKVHLLTTIRRLQPKIVNAITGGDVTALSQHFQLLQRLLVIEHPEVGQLIEGQVLPAINIAVFKRVEEAKNSAIASNFDDARRQLNQLISIVNHLPGVPLGFDINSIKNHISKCIADKDDKEATRKNIAALNEAVAEANRRLAENEKSGFWGRIIGGVVGFVAGGPAGAVMGYKIGEGIDRH
jgi:hypothetical protein